MASRAPRRPIVSGIVTAVVVAALTVPLLIMMATSLNAGPEQVFPPRGLSLRWYANILNRDGFLDAFRLTLVLAVLASSVSVFVGTLAALAVVRHAFPGRDALLTLLLSPLIVPGVVIGMAFLVTFSALRIYSSFLALFVLHVVITLPFAVRVVVASLTRFPRSLEEAAQVLGAPPWRAFLSVTLPVIRPGMLGAGVFTFITSFDNFTASQFLVWNRTTLPVEIYSYVRTENDPTAAAISTLLVLGVSLLALVMARLVGLDILGGGWQGSR
jgi:putative spermidine/putrescine transport system permease protein